MKPIFYVRQLIKKYREKMKIDNVFLISLEKA